MLQIHHIVCTKCKYTFKTMSGGVVYMPPNMTCLKCGHKNGTIGEMLGTLKNIFGSK